MNKRSAALTAGGLAASFMAGATAVTFHWGMGTSSAAEAAAPGPVKATKPLKPIVKHRTVVIHRKATPPSSAATGSAPTARTVVVPAPAPASITSASVTTTGGSPTASGESESEHEGSDD